MELSRYVLAGILTGVLGHSQIPQIFTISPSAARAGQTVAIRGQDFDPVARNNVVYFGGIKARVTGGSVAELRVDVPRGVQGGPVTVTTAGLIAQSPTPFLPLFAPFGPETKVAFAQRSLGIVQTSVSTNIALGDLDGDGDAELLICNPNGVLDIYLYQDRGPLVETNSFRRVAQLRFPFQPNTIKVLDWDADGRLDVLASSRTGELSLFRNIHAGGEFGPNPFAGLVRDTQAVSTGMWELADVDRDGKVEFAHIDSIDRLVLWETVYDPAVTNRLLASRMVLDPPRYGSEFAVGDLNRDGAAELVMRQPEELSVYSHNDRRGVLKTTSFQRLSLPATNVLGLEVVDVESDGFLDLLTHGVGGTFSVLWNRNQGGLIEAQHFQSVTLAMNRITGGVTPKFFDINGDGFLDLVPRPTFYQANHSGYVDNVIFSGTFSSTTNAFSIVPSITLSLNSVAFGDVNGDGALDIIGGPGTPWLLQNVSSLSPRLIGISRVEVGVAIEVAGRPRDEVQIEFSPDLTHWLVSSNTRTSIQPSGKATLYFPLMNKGFYRLRAAALD